MRPPNLEAMEQAKNTLIDLGIRYGPKVVTAIFIFLIGLFAARRFGHVLLRWLGRRELEPPVRQLIARLLSLIVLLLFCMLALQNLGIELLPLLASLGVVGVGLGLATQGVLSNLVAGLTIIFTRPFRIGEYIEVIGVEGQVVAIDLFSTTLVHTDRSQVIIPNRKMVGEILHNYGKVRQLDLAVGVAYATDLTRALAVIREVLAQSPLVLADPAPVVGVTELRDSSIGIAVKPWVAVPDYVAATGEIYKAIVEACRTSRIDLAFPQREVRILSATPSA